MDASAAAILQRAVMLQGMDYGVDPDAVIVARIKRVRQSHVKSIVWLLQQQGLEPHMVQQFVGSVGSDRIGPDRIGSESSRKGLFVVSDRIGIDTGCK